MSVEHDRLLQAQNKEAEWYLWGPYLADREWGTLREDYQDSHSFWDGFTHDAARSRAYRWGEDGIAGISDNHQYLCFALSLWNGKDPILKERYFGLTNPQGNHGEDVKEYYFYLDNTPTHSYMRMLYKYPQQAYPYEKLAQENLNRGLQDPEYQLLDTGIFNDNQYWDIFITYAKADTDDILVNIDIHNCADQTAKIWVLPTLWFRNTWSWGYPQGPRGDVPEKPMLKLVESNAKFQTIESNHPQLGTYFLSGETARDVLFTENETNYQKLYGKSNESKYVKDAFERYLIHKQQTAVNQKNIGTKAAFLYPLTIPGGKHRSLKLRLNKQVRSNPFSDFGETLQQRKQEMEAYYTSLIKNTETTTNQIQRQAWSGLLWSKQFYYFDVDQWLSGDPTLPRHPEYRKYAPNNTWSHLKNHHVISMPDKWEYPWYASWDLAFHCVAFAPIDLQFAKKQLKLLLQEGYMHPNGQLPAYENNFSSVNPPVIAWAIWELYQFEAKTAGAGDRKYLEATFHKLAMNFAWWLNRKDLDDHNIFEGGFLGLDNIGVMDRNIAFPGGGHLYQADSTAWMAMYALTMARIALELSLENPSYQDMAVKFFHNFMRITQAIAHDSLTHASLWDEHDGFYYDRLQLPDGHTILLKVRSLVGLLPICAAEVLDPELCKSLPEFEEQLQALMRKFPELVEDSHIASYELEGQGHRRLLAMVNKQRLTRILTRMLDEAEFLSPYGIRSLSKYHQHHPYYFEIDGQTHYIDYQPGHANSRMFGGNSNWRGPIWFPTNYLLIQALRKLYRYYGDSLKLEFPQSSGTSYNLLQIADSISHRMVKIFTESQGKRPLFGQEAIWNQDSNWKDKLQFYEFFNAETGEGLGASHQTGWTALIASLIMDIEP